ncbi:MAG: class I SAM-dependent methyltransferase [Acidobacteriota bacterium]|nr:class I SAM-dependent methyltransferase [Acidobacteriota bacterium]MDE3169431.1 class I SAM-dependent methyltransferase [Acidobacteriota bacterium]
MDRAVEMVIAEYERREQVENEIKREIGFDHDQTRRDEFLLSVGRSSAQLLSILAKSLQPKTILEVGGSYGYSTIWLAEAAHSVGGKLITLEIQPRKQQYARERMAKAGLSAAVDYRLGDARESIRELAGPFDFVLLDLWKELYIPCFELFYPKLNPGAIVVADNMIYPELTRAESSQYRAHVRTKPHIDSVLLPVGGGLEVSRFTRGAL